MLFVRVLLFQFCVNFPPQRAEFDSFWAQYEGRPLEGRNVIVASFCPQVFGLYVVKLSICLALIGGVQVQ